MNKKISNTFINHVSSFIDKFRLLPSRDKILLSISGGIDSMALLSLFLKLKSDGLVKEFCVVTFDHGLRPSSLHDARFVMSFCEQQGVNCDFISFNLGSDSNIEMIARQHRQNIYKQYAELGYFIYLAHHIDDAFEWKLLQQFKTSSRCLGIPLVRGKIIRPFMCVSKEMIELYASAIDLPYVQDDTNMDSRFERNYIRNSVIPLIKKRFPGYLKHFVHQSNRDALKLDKFRFKKEASRSHFYQRDSLGGITLFLPSRVVSLSLYKEEIFYIIQAISNKQRGSLVQEVDKLCGAYLNNKKGPMSFSGNVGCLLTQGALYFYPKDLDSKVKLSGQSKVHTLDCLWKFSYIEIDNDVATKLCTPLKRYPNWLSSLNQSSFLVATADLYTQIYITKRLLPSKLIDCNFRSVRLI